MEENFEAFKINDSHMIEINGRLSFTEKSLPPQRNKVRCHSISQDCILSILKCIINELLIKEIYSPEQEKRSLIALQLLGHAVFPETFQEEMFGDERTEEEENQRNNYFIKIEKIYLCNDINSALSFANKIAILLNDSILNLRYGDQNWNASVSNSFDPESWVFISQEGYSINNCLQVIDYSQFEPGIHLLSCRDIERLYRMNDLIDYLKQYTCFDYVFGVDIYEFSIGENICYILGSSNNPTIKTNNMVPAEDIIEEYICEREQCYIKLKI